LAFLWCLKFAERGGAREREKKKERGKEKRKRRGKEKERAISFNPINSTLHL
jgi:hypothetical protein